MRTLFFLVLLASNAVFAQQDTIEYVSCQCCNNEARQAEANRLSAQEWKHHQEAPSTFIEDVGESGETVAKGIYQGEVKPLVLGKIVGEVQSWFGTNPVGSMIGVTAVAGGSRAVQKSRNKNDVCQHTCKKNSPETLSLQHNTKDMNVKFPTFQEVVQSEELVVLNDQEKQKLLNMIHGYGFARASKIAFSESYLLVEGGNLEYYAGLEYVATEAQAETWKLYPAVQQAKTVIESCKKAIRK